MLDQYIQGSQQDLISNHAAAAVGIVDLFIHVVVVSSDLVANNNTPVLLVDTFHLSFKPSIASRESCVDMDSLSLSLSARFIPATVRATVIAVGFIESLWYIFLLWTSNKKI